MGKIRDWFIHLFGGVTKNEFDTVMVVNYILSKRLNEEKIAKQHVIEQARGWKKQWSEVSSLYKAELNRPNECIEKNYILMKRNSELQEELSKIKGNITLLHQYIVKVDGIPDEYIEQQICAKFAKDLLPYIKFTKHVIDNPAFCKQETNVHALLEVIKPNEQNNTR